MTRTTTAALLTAALTFTAACAGPNSHRTQVKNYTKQAEALPERPCGWFQGEMNANAAHIRSNDRYGHSSLANIQRSYQSELRDEFHRRCEDWQPKAKKDSDRIDHIEEKLDIERDERRHGELIEAIHGSKEDN